MRRRLDLAAALVARPPVLFLDEPTTGLDIRSRIELWDAIEALVSEGTTVLLTTQDLDEADRLADRIAVIDQGLVIAEGTPERAEDPGRRRAARHPPLRRRARRGGPRRSGLDRQRPPVSRGRLGARPRRPAPRDDRRRGPPAGRRRDRDRRHLRQHPDARRRLPEPDRACRPSRRPRKRRCRPGDGASLRHLRHARPGEAEPAADPAPAGPARRLHGPADPLHPAVRLRLRRGDPDARASTTSTS